MEKKFKTISKIQPAHVTKFNTALNELKNLYGVYETEIRNLDYLENQFDLLNIKEKENSKNIKLYLERM